MKYRMGNIMEQGADVNPVFFMLLPAMGAVLFFNKLPAVPAVADRCRVVDKLVGHLLQWV